MNAVEKELAESIIDLFKEAGGTITDMTGAFLSTKLHISQYRIDLILGELIRRGYMYAPGTYTHRLTDAGWQFKSFEDERLKAQRAAEVEGMVLEQLQLNVEDLRNKVFDYEKTKRLAKWGLICSGISAIAALIALWISLRK